jgi:thiamine monophosphate synthase
LASARLYVLIDGGATEDSFTSGVQAIIAGGAHLFQLRDKRLDDRALLSRARLLMCAIDESSYKPLLIINDRPTSPCCAAPTASMSGKKN